MDICKVQKYVIFSKKLKVCRIAQKSFLQIFKIYTELHKLPDTHPPPLTFVNIEIGFENAHVRLKVLNCGGGGLCKLRIEVCFLI